MIANFQYLPRSTPIHRLDPRTKIILLLCATTTAAFLTDLRLLLGLICVAFVYYSLARLPWSVTRRAWTFFLVFIVLVVGLNTLIAGASNARPDDLVLFRLPPGIQITWQKVIEAINIVCRLVIGALLAIPITFTIPPTQFGIAFRGLGISDRFAFAIDLAMRLVPTYADDFRSTMDAQRARGYELDKLQGGFLSRVRRLAPLIVPVTINAIVSGEDITNALDMRGFGLKPRTWLHKRSLRLIDKVLIAAALLLLIGGIAWRVAGGGQLWVPPYPFA